MPAERDTNAFCKATLSAMLLNYPPPTTINLKSAYVSDVQWERNTLNSTLHYLSNGKLVKDEDLVLIVDGQQAWFQLPSDVIIAQYKKLLKLANVDLLAKYGVDENGSQKFNETIIFGAEKRCQGDDLACRYVPKSTIPANLYEADNGRRVTDTPAKFLNSKVVMGPAKDLRTLYSAALQKFNSKRSQSQSVQSVLATMFSEQQLQRGAIIGERKPISTKLKGFLSGLKRSAPAGRLGKAKAAPENRTQYDFSIGLDYSHQLVQPLLYCAEDELVSLRHDNSTDLSIYPHAGILTIPETLENTRPPFWRADPVDHNPSPNEKPAYIEQLEITSRLDTMPKRNNLWNTVPLVQNTYTGAVPAILLNANSLHRGDEHPPIANITWNDMWYASYRRALLRNYFRTPQSPAGYHDSLVGGDRFWDKRGGRGGIWTEAEQIWLPWGEVDGVCGTLSQIKNVFDDRKGVWLHENEENSERIRTKLEHDFARKVQDDRTKEVLKKLAMEDAARKMKEGIKGEDEIQGQGGKEEGKKGKGGAEREREGEGKGGSKLMVDVAEEPAVKLRLGEFNEVLED